MEDKLFISPISKETDKKILEHFSHLLPQDMIGTMSDWEYVGAFYENTPCGILAYILDDEIILPWIYVDEAYRRRSIASQMVEALKNDLEEKLLFTGFSCEIVLDQDGSGFDLIDFFASIDDLDIAPKYCIYEVSPNMYKKSFAEHSLFKNTQNFVSQRFVDLPEYQKRALRNNPKVADIYQIDQIKKWEEGIEKDLSLCIIEDNEVTSAILLTDMGEDKMSIELVHANSTKALKNLLIAFAQALVHKNNEKSLIFRPVNEKIVNLAEGLFSEISVYGEVWEASTF